MAMLRSYSKIFIINNIEIVKYCLALLFIAILALLNRRIYIIIQNKQQKKRAYRKFKINIPSTLLLSFSSISEIFLFLFSNKINAFVSYTTPNLFLFLIKTFYLKQFNARNFLCKKKLQTNKSNIE